MRGRWRGRLRVRRGVGVRERRLCEGRDELEIASGSFGLLVMVLGATGCLLGFGMLYNGALGEETLK